ncbi:MAG TPA: phage tail protein [Polyangiaceae bacterium]
MASLTTVVRLPDLKKRSDDPPASGWFVLVPPEGITVPDLDSVRRCDEVVAEPDDPCTPRIVSFDPPHRTVIIERGTGTLVVSVRVRPGVLADFVPELVIEDTEEEPFGVPIAGTVVGSCRDEFRFEWPLASVPDGTYELSVTGYDEQTVRIGIGAETASILAIDPCALVLTPSFRAVGVAVETRPDEFPRPPLLAVDSHGCTLEAWSVNALGWVLVPNGENAVELSERCSGGSIATMELEAPVRDAVFWRDTVAVLTDSAVVLFDLQGCPLAPDPFAAGFDGAVALGITDEGFLAVVQTGDGTSASRPGNLHVLRRDGSEVRAPATFDGRGFYAGLRSKALVFDPEACVYRVDASRVSSECCAAPARALTDEESLFFRLIDDLKDLRKRAAFPPSGNVIIGPAQEEDPLDGGRPTTAWHRVLVFGEIPDGCGVRLETRAFDSLVAGDPLLVPGGWSAPVTATPDSTVPVRSPGDTRIAAADAMVLARPGRYLWLRVTLLSNGIATPRITSFEIERPRLGIARFLPAVYQNSTPEDDFLRRWLAIFESTVFDGVALRFDQYAALFDPRTAPPEMLPFLADWLEVLETAKLRDDEAAFRRALVQADALAKTRGTIDGLVLALRIYMGLDVQIVESFKRRAGFLLGTGARIDDVIGPALGCQTSLGGAKSATFLNDEPFLGCSFLLDCEDTGSLPFGFDVIVSARDVCTTVDLELLRFIIETEKPAHTSFRIRPMGTAGFVLGVQSVVGQEVNAAFDRDELDPVTFGIGLLNGPPRPKPIGLGFALGSDSRLAAEAGQPVFRLGATVGRTSRVGP